MTSSYLKKLRERSKSISIDAFMRPAAFELPANIKKQPSIEKKYKMLIANDDEMQLMILDILYSKFEIQVSQARNGHEAFEQVQMSIRDPSQLFDIILLDLNMPISNGYEAC